MNIFLSHNHFSNKFSASNDLSMNNDFNNLPANNYHYLHSNQIDGKYDLSFSTNNVLLKSDNSNYNPNYDGKSMKVNSINSLLDDLLDIAATKCLPQLEEVQIAKERSKCHRMLSPLFCVLSDLKRAATKQKA